MKKRYVLSLLTAFIMAMTTLGGIAQATPVVIPEGATYMFGAPKASPTLALYSTSIEQGSAPGCLKIYFDVRAKSKAEEVGVSYIDIYDFDGRYEATISSSPYNNFLAKNTSSHSSFCYYPSATSGESYYAIVTVTATIDGVSDSKEVITNTVEAP